MVFRDSPCAHFVCMDEQGQLFDPMFGLTTQDRYHMKPYSRLVCRRQPKTTPHEETKAP
jgi:hypothetical protein